MSAERVKVTATINLDRPDNTEMPLAFSQATDCLDFSSGGEDWTPNGTHYTYMVESNQPSKPMTLPALLEMVAANGSDELRRKMEADFVEGGLKSQPKV
ncbi:hypothetical protein ACI77O_12375 [Pseudomonas tritici]|uniref:hypothetical protein n=1 Tax=Pseudomonas tritici TaxID=2745518 RepID=UPI00387B35BD